MDNIDRECECEDKMLDQCNDATKKDELLGNEARQSFFQLENLIFHTDAKALGMIAINSLFITFSRYVFSSNDGTQLWYILCIVFGVSVFSMMMCIAPRYYDHRYPSSVIQNSSKDSYSQVAEQMAVDYAWAFDKTIDKIYNEKEMFFVIGFIIAVIGMCLLTAFSITFL